MLPASIRRRPDPLDVNHKTSKPITPIPIQRSSSAKEKSRPKSLTRASVAPTQKPSMRPVPPLSKSAREMSEGRFRRSTSTAPRGRSPSPSEFIRVFSDSAKERGPKVSSVQKVKKLSPETGEEGKENRDRLGQNVPLKVKGKDKKAAEFRVFNGSYKKGNNFGPGLAQSGVPAGAKTVSQGNHETNGPISSFNHKAEVVGDEKSAGLHSSGPQFEEQSGKTDKNHALGGLKVVGVSADHGKNDNDEMDFPQVAVKYPSKLHEKLAFLEGKVKRIASDIKKTKEMLETNNPSSSKLILSDIQAKISGIEMAVNHVAGDSEGKIGDTKISMDAEVVDRRQSEDMSNGKISVKGLSSEELEARLFPHHKLLRNRASAKVSSGISETSEYSDEKKPLSPIEDNPIAKDLLASLNEEQPKDCLKDLDVYEMDGAGTSQAEGSSKILHIKGGADPILTTEEKLEDFDDQENSQKIPTDVETETTGIHQLNEIGQKIATGGWFVSEGEAVLLAHDDGSCSYYDIANSEEKSVYKPPAGISANMWRDCWIIRAPSADGCSGRYVVAASAGNSLESGFCCWDFYTKDLRACQSNNRVTASRKVLAPLPNNMTFRRNVMCDSLLPETMQWWYRPCGPLIMATASAQNVVNAYDIRDGEQIMKWELQKPVLAMDHSSPLQWRNRGKIVVAELDKISVWDVNSQHPQALTSVISSGRKISALHINNTDAEIGGGIRQRASSSEVEGNDGVFCTADAINILDFRHPSGIGAKVPKPSVSVQSVLSRGDSVFIGCNAKLAGKSQSSSQVQQFSLRRQCLFCTYSLPDSQHHSAITQVWGSSEYVMAVNGSGLSVFDALKDNGLQSLIDDVATSENAMEVIGPDGLYSPSFDYLASRVLIVSRDRPALWRRLS